MVLGVPYPIAMPQSCNNQAKIAEKGDLKGARMLSVACSLLGLADERDQRLR
jgi:hypothetical protein